EVLRDYDKGYILQYKTLTSDWYEATVIINHQPYTGYINKKDVENFTDNQSELKGIALKNPTNVYAKASTSSEVLKNYDKGHILQYKTLTSDWYEATVIINHQPYTGYINKKDVANLGTEDQTELRGVSLGNPTNVYQSPSTNSETIKSYDKGVILEIRTYSEDWFEATVYINHQKHTGYVRTDDVILVDVEQETMYGYPVKNPTNVYAEASRNSKVIKSYPYGSKELQFKNFTDDWYEANVIINGEQKNGYINTADITFNKDPLVSHTSYDLTLDEAVDIQMKANPQTDNNVAYVSKTYINNKNKMTADVLNVRAGAGTDNDIVGQLTEGSKVTITDEYNGWYQIKFNHSTQWVDAGPTDVRYYLNPANFINDSKRIFQFLDLSKPSGATANELNKFLRGKGILGGKGRAFIDAALENNINDLYLISHALLETGNGTSTLAQGIDYNGTTVYNMYGVGAEDSCPLECGAKKAYD